MAVLISSTNLVSSIQLRREIGDGFPTDCISDLHHTVSCSHLMHQQSQYWYNEGLPTLDSQAKPTRQFLLLIYSVFIPNQIATSPESRIADTAEHAKVTNQKRNFGGDSVSEQQIVCAGTVRTCSSVCTCRGCKACKTVTSDSLAWHV
jgi:hypothetical protein